MPYSASQTTVAILADDLTGANDTALQFHQPGYEAHVLLNGGQIDASQPEHGGHIWAFNTESRHMPAEQAVMAVRRATEVLTKQFSFDHLYKKLDSTLRGHVGLECLTILEAWQGDCALIVPAFPEESRATVGGYQLVKGIPLEKSDFSRDPLAPVRESHIPTLLSQTVHPDLIGYVGLSTVMNGAGPILVALHEQIKAGCKLVVVDACLPTDLDQIALVIEKMSHNTRILPCGSAGLAKALRRFWTPASDQPAAALPPMEMPAAPILMLIGSNTEITRSQLVELTACYTYYGEGSSLRLITVKPEELLGLAPLEGLLNEAQQSLREGATVVVSSSYPEGNYAATMALAQEKKMDPQTAAKAAQVTLAKIADWIQSRQPVRLVLSGGETATQICEAMNSLSLSILSEVEPSIPLLRDQQGRWLVTKSGGLGSPLALANIVQYLKTHEAASSHVAGG